MGTELFAIHQPPNNKLIIQCHEHTRPNAFFTSKRFSLYPLLCMSSFDQHLNNNNKFNNQCECDEDDEDLLKGLRINCFMWQCLFLYFLVISQINLFNCSVAVEENEVDKPDNNV